MKLSRLGGSFFFVRVSGSVLLTWKLQVRNAILTYENLNVGRMYRIHGNVFQGCSFLTLEGTLHYRVSINSAYFEGNKVECENHLT